MGYIGQQITTVFPTSISVDSATVGDDLTVDTSTLKVDSSNNRVGIGTASPEENLEVSHATAPAIQLNRTNDGGFKSIIRQQGNDFEIRGSSGSTKIYTGNADGDSSTSRLIIDANGHVTMPNQPAFQVNCSFNQSNFGAGSTHTVAFDTEVFDQNSDFGSNVFTAPVTGKYQLQFNLNVRDLDTAASTYTIRINSSNRNYELLLDPNFSSDMIFPFVLSVLADMDSSDTAKCEFIQSGGSSQSDINSAPEMTFSGYLVC